MQRIFGDYQLTSWNKHPAGGHKCIQQSSSQSLKVLTSDAQYFTFDAIAGEATDQEGVFEGGHRPATITQLCLPHSSAYGSKPQWDCNKQL